MLIVGLGFLAAALLLALLLLLRVRRVAKLRVIGTRVIGRVSTDHTGDGLMMVEWTDAEGQKRHTMSSLSSSFLPQLDEPAHIVYDPKDWRRAEIEEVDRLSRRLSAIAIILCTAIGTTLLLLP